MGTGQLNIPQHPHTPKCSKASAPGQNTPLVLQALENDWDYLEQWDVVQVAGGKMDIESNI